LQLNLCGHNSCVTSSLKTGWICLLQTSFAFVKCRHRTYSIGLHVYGELLFFSCSHSNTAGTFQLGVVWPPSLQPWPHSKRVEGVKTWLSAQAADFFDAGIQKPFPVTIAWIPAVATLRSSLKPRFHGAWHASVRQVFVSTTHVNEASWKFLW
jgi:hypothetical protein